VTGLFNSVREAFRSLAEAKMVTFVSIMTVAITLFFLTLTYLVVQNVGIWFEQFEDRPTIVAYLELDLTTDQELFVSEQITLISEIDSTTFISRDDAYLLFSKLHGKEMLTSVEGNIFPASVEIIPSDTASARSLEQELIAIDGVESVAVARELLDAVKRYRRYLHIGAIVLAMIMVFALFFTITNTIKLTVYARQELVRNMRYVGASRWYIRIPFIIEGMLQGVLGAFAAWIGIELLALLTISFPLYWGGYYLLPAMLLIGGSLGSFGSLTAVRRFVK